MTQFATIKNGTWRGYEVDGTFEVIRPWKQGEKGGFITVVLDEAPGGARVKCNQRDVIITTDGNDEDDGLTGEVSVSNDIETEVRSSETEDQAIERIRRSFEIVEEMTSGAADGSVRGLIVSGPPGIGKSFGVEEKLREMSMLHKLANKKENYSIVKGATTPIALYQILWHHRHKGKVVVFDDCDTILFDDVSLNLLKAALDSSKKRTIGWNAESRVLKEVDIPNTFEFEGSVIFLTNIDFDNVRSKRLQPHLDALKSRCLYLDLDINDQKDMLLRIRQIMRDGLFRDYNFSGNDQIEMYEFVVEHVNDLRELSLRTMLKIGDLRSTNPGTWRELAVHTVMKPEAKWRHLAKTRMEGVGA